MAGQAAMLTVRPTHACGDSVPTWFGLATGPHWAGVALHLRTVFSNSMKQKAPSKAEQSNSTHATGSGFRGDGMVHAAPSDIWIMAALLNSFMILDEELTPKDFYK